MTTTGVFAQATSVVRTYVSPHSASFNGCQGFALDILGDDEEELIAFEDRFLQIVGPTGADLLYVNEPRSAEWELKEPLFVRVGDGKKYVVLKHTGQWGGQLGLMTLYSDPANGYSFGQYVATLPFAGNFEKILGDPVVLPGSSGRFTVCAQTNGYLHSFQLAVSTTGALSLTSVGSYNASTAPNCGDPNATGVHLGNGVSRYRLFDGTNYAYYDFCSDILRETSTGFACAGSWVGVVDPQLTVPIGYEVYNHIDGSVVVDRGQPNAPDYWIYAMYENDALIWGRLTVTPGGVAIDVLGTYPLAVRGHSVSVGRVRGFAGPVVVASDHFFDLDGNVLATSSDGSKVEDVYFDDLFAGGVPTSQAWIYRPNGAGSVAPFGPVAALASYLAPPGAAHHSTGTYGIVKYVGRALHYDASGYWKQRIVAFNNADAANLLELETAVVAANPASQTDRDANLAWIQMSHVNRGWDHLRRDLALGTMAAPPTTAPAPLCVTETFDDATFGSFERASGSGFVFSNGALVAQATGRVVLTGRRYGDSSAYLTAEADMPNAATAAIVFRGATPQSDWSVATGPQTNVFLRRNTTGDFGSVRVRYAYGTSGANPYTEVITNLPTSVNFRTQRITLYAEIVGSTVSVRVDGVPTVTVTGVDNPANGGFTSLRASLPSSPTGVVGFANAIVRPAGYVADAGRRDRNGTIWASILKPNFAVNFQSSTFFYGIGSSVFDYAGFQSFVASLPPGTYSQEVLSADAYLFGIRYVPELSHLTHLFALDGTSESQLVY